MSKKVKRKMKKSLLIFFIIIAVILVGIIGVYFCTSNLKTEKNVKSHYNQFVITTKKAKLYDKNKKEIGTIEKDITLELDKENTKNDYYKIKDTSYYINYNDTKKTKNNNSNSLNEKYLVFNNNVKTKKTTELYKDDKLVVKINESVNLPIQVQDSDYYYVSFSNNLLRIKKDTASIENSNNTDKKESKQVSVLYYFDVENECNTYNCVKTDDFKNQMQKLKDEGYYTINKDDFWRFIHGNIRLEEKAIYVITTNQNEIVNNIAKELNITIDKEETGFHFVRTNKPAVKESLIDINKYQVKSYTTIDDVLRMANGEEVPQDDPTPPSADQKIAVLNYHFFYDPNEGETCNEGICLTTDKFREHLQYLKDEGFKTLTMNEFMRWMYGEIELPEKSVLITIDDGAMGTGKHNGNKLIPLLEEYDMHATLFLITGWWDISNYISPNLDIQSHTNDMHQYGDCGKGQLVCYGYDKAKADLEQSVAIIGNTDSFCYPFYSYSDTAIQAVKDTGFRIAFAGGNVKASRQSNKWTIPRYPIHSDITMEKFKSMVN